MQCEMPLSRYFVIDLRSTLPIVDGLSYHHPPLCVFSHDHPGQTQPASESPRDATGHMIGVDSRGMACLNARCCAHAQDESGVEWVRAGAPPTSTPESSSREYVSALTATIPSD